MIGLVDVCIDSHDLAEFRRELGQVDNETAATVLPLIHRLPVPFSSGTRTR